MEEFAGPVNAAARGTSAFVGRQAELAVLVTHLEGALSGQGAAVLIAGEPGIGKTRLADEIARLAAQRGAEAHWGQCWESGGAPPFWPWVQVLRSVLSTRDPAVLGPSAGVLTRLVPELPGGTADGGRELPVGEGIDRFVLFDALAVAFTALARDRPLVLLLEDVQWADQSSVQALVHLAGLARGSALLVIATARSAEAAQRDDLAALERIAPRVELHGLGDEEVADLLRRALGRDVEVDLLNRVLARCDGNPFFVQAVGTSIRTGEAEAVPASVRALVRHQIDRLPPTARTLIEFAAVLGRELAFTQLRLITGLSPETLLDALDDAERAGVLRPLDVRGARYEFVHDLVRETIYGDLSPRRRAELHASITAALEQLYGGTLDAPVAELAHHAVASLALGGADRAIELARRAGDHARRQLGYDEAAGWYRQAWEVAVAAPSLERSLPAELLLAEGAALRAALAGNASDVLNRAAEEARAIGDADLLARVVVTWGYRHGGSTLFDRRLFPLIASSLDGLSSEDSPLRARVLGVAAIAKARRGETDAGAVAEEALAMAERTADARARLDALCALHAVHQVAGDLSSREVEAKNSLAGRLEEAARSLADPDALADALWLRATSALVSGDEATVERVVATLADPPFGRTLLTRILAAIFRWALAGLRGDVAVLEVALAEGRELLARRDAGTFSIRVAQICHGHLLGREDPLPSLTTLAGEEAGSPEEGVYARIFEPALRCAEAALMAQRGDTAAAKAILRHPPRGLYWSPGGGTRMAVAFLAEACADSESADLAADAYAWLAPASGNVLYTDGGGWTVMGSIDHYLSVLATALARYDDAERHLAGALELEEHLGSPHFAARTHYRWARLALARGAAGDSEIVRQHASACLELCRRHGMEYLASRVEAIDAGPDRGEVALRSVPEVAVFRREGDFWTISFEHQTVRLKHSKGMQYLARLLAQPGQEMHALDLAGASAADRGDAGPVLDEKAKRAYRSRLADLQEDLEEAQRFNDPARAERVRAEMEALTDELAAAVGLGHRNRSSGSSSERARVAATRGIRTALDRIAAVHLSLGRHLNSAIRTGTYCVYEPDPRAPIEWKTV